MLSNFPLGIWAKGYPDKLAVEVEHHHKQQRHHVSKTCQSLAMVDMWLEKYIGVRRKEPLQTPPIFPKDIKIHNNLS